MQQSGRYPISPGDTRSGITPSLRRSTTLNEGRGISPGDTSRALADFGLLTSAQRRPGHQPRRHVAAAWLSKVVSSIAQRRPGHQPRRHPAPAELAALIASCAQRRPGHQPRRHTIPLVPITQATMTPPPLNEGRGISPGDTFRRQTTSKTIPPRSTKAGASAPATLPPSMTGPASAWYAQRRPGHQPRRHAWGWLASGAMVARSTKAGASAPATPLGTAKNRDHGSGRSTKAGASAPATRPAPPAAPSRHRPLNEGRGISPGDTQKPDLRTLPDAQRSTKAGASAPATPASNATPDSSAISAQRRPGHQPRRHETSTTSVKSIFQGAQRRPGHQPRRHQACPSASPRHQPTLNEGRGISPGDTAKVCKRAVPRRNSSLP